VDDQSVGIAFRVARIRKGWTQQELGDECDVSHGLISLIERGHLDSVSLRVLRRVARASAWVVVAESKPNRRRAVQHRALLRSAFPQDGRQMRGWLRRPVGTFHALSFWSKSNPGSVSQSHAVRRRVRKPRSVRGAVGSTRKLP
jgi:transcriptional regulator with XRE-family HTH domain